MKTKYLLFLFISFIPFTLHAQNNDCVVTYYKNSTPKASINRRTGESKTWNKSKRIETKGTYKDKLPEGLWIFYSHYGNKKSEHHFSKGKLQGESIVYYLAGPPLLIANYQNGKPKLPWSFYSKAGKETKITTYNAIKNLKRNPSFLTAFHLAQKNLDWAKKHFEDTYIQRIRFLIQSAQSFSSKKKISTAILHYTETLELEKEILGGKALECADILEVLASLYYDQNKLEKALDLAKEAVEIRKIKQGEKHLAYASSLADLGGHYYLNHRYKEAFFSLNKALSIQKEKVGEKDPIYINTLGNLAFLYKMRRKYTLALQLYNKCAHLRKDIHGEMHRDYAKTLNEIADLYYDTGDFKKAILQYEKIAIVYKNVLGEKHLDYVTSLDNLASAYNEQGEYTKASSLYTKILTIHKEILGEKNLEYTKRLNNLALVCFNQGKYAKAELLYIEVLKINKEILGEQHPDYAANLNNLALVYSNLGKYTKALTLCGKALEIYEAVLGRENSSYSHTVDNMAQLYQKQGKYTKALTLYVEALKIDKRILGEKHPDYAKNLNNLSQLYQEQGKYAEALILLEKALEIDKNALGKKHPMYVTILSNLAVLYQAKGEYSKALSLFKKALILRKKILGEKHPDYAISLNNLAQLYSNLRNNTKALPLFKKALEINKKTFGIESIQYSLILNNLAHIYCKQRNSTKALPLFKKALEINKKIVGKMHPDYANSLDGLTCLYSNLAKYGKALPLCQEALEIRKEALGEKHPDYAISLSNLAKVYENLGNYTKPLPLYQEALALNKKIYGINHPDYVTSLDNLAILYKKQGKISAALPLLSKSLKAQETHFYENLNSLNEHFVSDAFCKDYSNLLTILDIFKETIFEKLPQQTYETINAFKGVQLYAQKVQRELLMNHPNPQIRSLYEKLVRTKTQQSNLKLEKKKDPVIYQELQKQIDKTRFELFELSSTFRQDFTPPTLAQIQKAIKSTEVFVDYYKVDQDFYAAVISAQEAPKWYKLSLSDNLKQDIIKATNEENIEHLYSNEKLYNALLKPIETHILHKNLIISPDGLLHKIAFHAIQTPSKQRVGKLFNLREISSSRSLYASSQKKTDKTQKTELYGGIYYDDTQDKETQNDDIFNKYAEFIHETKSRSTQYQSGFTYLKGSDKEVLLIKQMLGNKALCYRGKEATESRFRSMDKHSPQTLVISTHGFYLPSNDERNIYNAQNDPMMHCGLALSGANSTWLKKQKKLGENDGILLAKEVSELNLSQTRLVVLSACQTALGKITDGEGVFGLQRGFKKAGVDFILASLWQVPDRDTQELMVAFFSNLKQHNDPRRAIKEARKEMKNKGKSIYQYAGFVLLR